MLPGLLFSLHPRRDLREPFPMPRILALFLFAAVSPLVAEPPVPSTFRTRDGTVYTGVTAITVKPDGLTVTHAAGVSKVGFYALTDGEIRDYGLTREGAEEFARQERLAKREAEAKKQAAMIAWQQRQNAAALEKENGFDATGTIVQVLPGRGVLYRGFRIEEYTDTQKRVANSLANQTTDPLAYKRMETVTVRKQRRVPLGGAGLSFVECKTDDLADNDELTTRLYKIGNFPYTDSEGNPLTLPRYTNSFPRFAEYFHSRQNE